MKKTKLKHHAFTLVEILAVLAAIVVMTAILLPVFEHVRANGRTSTCVSNLHQISLGINQYTSDHDGFYPPVITMRQKEQAIKIAKVWWMNLGLQPVPSCPDVDPDWLPENPTIRTLINGYAINLNLTNNMGSKVKPLFSGQPEFVLHYPSLTVVAFDSRPLFYGIRHPDTIRSPSEMKGIVFSKDFVDNILELPPGAQRHQGGANYLFGDGHVKWQRAEQLATTAQNDGVHPGFGL